MSSGDSLWLLQPRFYIVSPVLPTWSLQGKPCVFLHLCDNFGKVGSRACVFLLLMSRDFTFPWKAYCNVFNEHPLQNSNLIAGTTCPYQITNLPVNFSKNVSHRKDLHFNRLNVYFQRHPPGLEEIHRTVLL